MHGYGPSNKIRHQLQPKKTEVRLYIAAKGVISAYITNKTEHGPFRHYNAWAWPESQNSSLLQPKKTKVRLYYSSIQQQKALYTLYKTAL